MIGRHAVMIGSIVDMIGRHAVMIGSTPDMIGSARSYDRFIYAQYMIGSHSQICRSPPQNQLKKLPRIFQGNSITIVNYNFHFTLA